MKEQFQNITPIVTASQFNVLASGERFGKRWLLKGLKPEYADKRLYIDLLSKEFDIAMRLHHPGIVGVVSIERINQLGLCIVEEWIDGVTLDQWITQPHTPQEKLNTLQELLRAVAHCHALQIIHRDLKPTNIMITREGQHVKIIDFGLSDTDSYSSLKGAAGTAHYVAPEVLEAPNDIDARSDIYSLGKIMEDMKLPKQYRAIISQATYSSPLGRYHSATQLLDAIQQVSRHSRRNKHLAFAVIAATVLCIAAFFAGYNYNFNSGKSQLATTSLLEIPGWTRGDSMSLARDTSLMMIEVPEKDFSVFVPNPGTDKLPTHIPESEAVDLGLNVDWAPFNVGASATYLLTPGMMFNGGMENPFTVLASFCYGDHSPKRNESFEGTRFDAAHNLWGGKWRMPIVEDFKELVDKCHWQFIDQPGTLPGYLVTGPSKKSIFLPLAGFRYENRYFSIGDIGYYWTATRAQPKEDWKLAMMAFIINDDMIIFQPLGILNGFSIRPVIDKRPHKINSFYNLPCSNEDKNNS